MGNSKINDVINIPIDNIIRNPYQPRKIFNIDSLNELADSIKSYGVIQPISVRELEGGYEIIMGERRFRASQIANATHIPAIIVDISDDDSAVVALVENLQRENLNFLEEASALSKLIEEHNLTQKEIADKIGKKQSTISNKLRILNLSDSVKEKILLNNLTERHARALLKVDEKDRVKILNRVVKNGLNVKKTEELIASLNKNAKRKTQKRKSFINYKIYVNTIKQAYKTILDTGFEAEYQEVDKGDYIELTVKIPKEDAK